MCTCYAQPGLHRTWSRTSLSTPSVEDAKDSIIYHYDYHRSFHPSIIYHYQRSFRGFSTNIASHHADSLKGLSLCDVLYMYSDVLFMTCPETGIPVETGISVYLFGSKSEQ